LRRRSQASKNGSDALPPDDIQKRKRRSGRLLGAALQLRHVANRQIQVMRKNRLTE
jgi:hypothetical protein